MLLNVVQIGFSRPSPGANDDGSGLLVLLELARRFGADKPHRDTLHLLASGAEEAGFFGVKAFMRSHKELDRENTLFINLESIGGGDLHWVTSEGCLQRIATPRAGLAVLDDLEKINVIPVLPRAPILSPTDSTALGKKGYNFVTLIALKDKSSPINYHRVTDTFDKLDIPTLMTAADVIEKLIRYYCG
jgi:Zn-dependent M28 family amino/carboxypeptidase